MIFPEVERVIYGTNPLTEVVCQLRFPRILELDQSVPANFQKIVCDQFPLIESREATTFTVGLGVKESAPSRQIIYDFATKDRTVILSLCSDFIALKTTNYTRWEEFFELLLLAIGALRSAYKVPFYSRIGIRYINVIDRKALGIDETEWTDLIRPSALGLLGDPEVNDEAIEEQVSLTTLKFESGRVNIRCGVNSGGNSGSKSFIIDSDFFCEDQVERDEDARELLTQYNGFARNAFRWFVNEPLNEALAPSAA